MSLNVLIVDDSLAMRKFIRRVLNLSGFELGEVSEAEDGEKALTVLDTKCIDVVLTDLYMPVMDGIELLKKMKSSEILSAIPVIIISTEGRNQRIEEILAMGANGFISKPFKPEDIRSVFSKALGVDFNGHIAGEPEDSDF